MSLSVSLTLLAATLAGTTPCPDDGRIRFYRSKDGFEGFTLLGEASYTSLFAGARLERRGGAGQGPREPRTFSVDGLKVAWELVPDRTFTKAERVTAEERLEAFYTFQTQRLRTLSRQRRIALSGIQSYRPHSEERVKGAPVTFRIWKALLGNERERHAQYWVATSQERGVVLLSVVVRGPSDEPKATQLIDAYMEGFGAVDASTCARISSESVTAPAKG
jgi:hypothetical protein